MLIVKRLWDSETDVKFAHINSRNPIGDVSLTELDSIYSLPSPVDLKLHIHD